MNNYVIIECYKVPRTKIENHLGNLGFSKITKRSFFKKLEEKEVFKIDESLKAYRTLEGFSFCECKDLKFS